MGRLRKAEGGLTLAGKLLSICTAACTLVPAVGFASIKVFGIELKADHDADIREIKQEIKLQTGMIECLGREVEWESCPAVKAQYETR